jgi:hypothetical protein
MVPAATPVAGSAQITFRLSIATDPRRMTDLAGQMLRARNW